MNNTILALGMFDGVHTGHQKLLVEATTLAKAYHARLVVSTFNQHPARVLSGHEIKWLTLPPERAELLHALGADDIESKDFTREYARTTAEDYVAQINARAVVCGASHTFGAFGAGNVQTLVAAGIEVHVIAPETYQNESISSTRIRAALSCGDVEAARAMLNRPYRVSGTVIHGRGIGRTLNFPTANLALPLGRALPAYGVYAAWVYYENIAYPAVLNIGLHPTIPGDARIEAHIKDFSGDLYGAHIDIDFVKLLRREMKFETIDALTAQVHRDMSEAWAILA